MRTGVLVLLLHLASAAPGLLGTHREEAADVPPPSHLVANPFGAEDEARRLLQTYIQSTLKEGGPEITSWEQEIFFLFGLYDYDRSGFLDGLEMMRLLSDFNSHHTPGAQANELVVSMVDFLLQTQDVNQDGLLAPSELLSPPSPPHIQDSSNNRTPHQEQEATVEEKNPGTEEQREEDHEEVQPREEQSHQDIKTEVEAKLTDNEDELPESQAAEQEQHHVVPVVPVVPVHQGQPEI